MTNRYYQGCAGKIDPRSIADFTFDERYYIIEEKYDGIWASVEYDAKGIVTLVSRLGKVKDNEQLQSLIHYLQDFDLRDTVLIGELAFGSQKAKEFSDKHGHHKIDLFDALVVNGKQQPVVDIVGRKYALQKLLYSKKADPMWASLGWFEFVGDADYVKKKYAFVVERGGEGLIVKDTRDKEYRPGGKSSLWYKIKKLVSMDYVIMGYGDTDLGDFAGKGWIGSVKCGLYVGGELVEKVSLGSFTFEEREMFSKNREKFIGEVIEVGGNEIFKSGSIRHPFYKGLRDDKDVKDCVW